MWHVPICEYVACTVLHITCLQTSLESLVFSLLDWDWLQIMWLQGLQIASCWQITLEACLLKIHVVFLCLSAEFLDVQFLMPWSLAGKETALLKFFLPEIYKPQTLKSLYHKNGFNPHVISWEHWDEMWIQWSDGLRWKIEFVTLQVISCNLQV